MHLFPDVMKRIFLLLAAALSVGAAAWAATRPHFGGTLSVEIRGILTSFDAQSKAVADDDFLRDTLLSCVCDRLIGLDSNGEPRPSLATSWRSERDGRSWYFTLRKNVIFHSGATLTPQIAIASLALANPNWRVRAEGGGVLIQSDTPLIDLPYELAEPRNSICLAGNDGRWIGSGPFQLGEFRPGQQIDLKASDQAWQGRPFLDSLHFEMGKTLADQNVDLQMGHADLVEGDVPQPGSVTSQSQAAEPIELVAMVFAPNRPATSDPRLREAISRSLDRNSIFTVLLRRQGESSASLLPEWISGYAHLFTVTQDLSAARRLATQAGAVTPLSIGYDARDPLAKLIAERVAVNAREAGIGLQPASQTNVRSSNADATVVRLRIESPNPATALAGLGSLLPISSLQKPQAATSLEALYSIESETLKDFSVIPIAHIPEKFAGGSRVHDWRISGWGELNWGYMWMEASQ